MLIKVICIFETGNLLSHSKRRRTCSAEYSRTLAPFAENILGLRNAVESSRMLHLGCTPLDLHGRCLTSSRASIPREGLLEVLTITAAGMPSK